MKKKLFNEKNTFGQRLKKMATQVTTFQYIIGVTVIALIARLVSLTKASIWHDEGYTMMLIQHNPIEIIERTARDVHPPLYYIISHFWQLLAGDSEFSIRFLSVLFGVATVIVAYLVLRRLFGEQVARISGLFLALGPFLVRYSEEARMYAMATFLIVLATYLLILALQKTNTARKSWLLWIGYGLVVAAGLYTHYYVAFLVPVHIGLAWWLHGGFAPLVKNIRWWVGNVTAVALFLPWVPSVLSQMSRVQSGFWIPPVDAETLPNTYMQFLAFSSNTLPPAVELIITMVISLLVLALILRHKNKQGALIFLAAWFIVPLLIVILLSLSRPIYYDRYFTFSAVAFYALIAAIVVGKDFFNKHILVKIFAVVAICSVFIVGIYSVDNAAQNSRMRDVGHYVSAQYQPGDYIISAELYTYFDFTYYNQTPQETKLLSKDPLSGYGETSLIYDRSDEIVIKEYTDIPQGTTRVWVVGKPWSEAYKSIPQAWQETSRIEASDSTARLYKVSAE